MFVPILLIILALALLQAARCYIAFRRNLKAAKASGIPYLISPVYPIARTWLVTQKLWTPFLYRLPKSWTESWLALCLEDAPWALKYAPFQKHGTDTLLTVAPGSCELKTADASVISQITSRRSDFPKPLEVYGSLMLYGANVVTTEGPMWKDHRRITSPSFSEKNNGMVWAESIFQAQSMMDILMGDDLVSSTVSTLGEESMRLSLHVISGAGFGQRLQWPRHDQEPNKEETGPSDAKIKSTQAAGEQRMSFADTLKTLLDNMVWILIVPKPILKWLPFKTAKLAYQAYVEWGVYLREMYATKKEELISGTQQEAGLDLMGALINGSGMTGEKPDAGTLESGEHGLPQLSESDILGNAFVFTLAGHETTANSIHFSLIYLAAHPSAQLKLQADLDRIFQRKPPSEWDYERDFPKLLNSMANAVLSEELRLIPPVNAIPKCTRTPQSLTVNGKKCFVPANTYISLLSPATHRNPNYWPTGPPSDPEHPIHPISNTDNDLEEFKPERWLVPKSDNATNNNTSRPSTPTTHDESHLDTPTTLYRPRHGSYIPFSEGARSCLGRRFAQVEVLAVLATIFSQYSVELALDEYATEEEIGGMSEGQRGEVWEKARLNVHTVLKDNMQSIFTLKMVGTDVKLRFRRRGM